MRFTRFSLFSAAAITVAASAAGAQRVEFVGTATGCFYTGATPVACGGGTTSSSVGNGTGLVSYAGSSFDVFSNTADGKLTIGDFSPSSGLGAFTLTGGQYDFTGKKFALFLAFTQPDNVSGNGTYKAKLEGNLSQDANGAVDVNFNNADHLFEFDDGISLKFKVLDVALNNSNPVNDGMATIGLSGTGVVTTPEPGSLALLGTGLFGLVPMVRRRKQK